MMTGTYVPTANGIAVSISQFKKTLEEMGHEVWVLAPHNPNAPKKEIGVLRYPSLPNPLVKDYPIALVPGFKNIWEVFKNKRPDIIHTHHPFYTGSFARLLAQQLKVPIVFTYHTHYDQYSEKYIKFLPKKLKKEMVQNSVNKFCAKVDHIVVPSNHVQEALKKNFPYQEMTVLPSGVSLTLSNRSKSELRGELNLPFDKILILNVGRIAKEKNPRLLIDTIKKLPKQYQLVLVGDGPYKTDLEKYVKKLNVTDRVTFVGKVAHEEIAKYFQSADVFLYTSETETQGIIFMEAMYVGLPIVSVDSPAARELTVNGIGALVEPKSKLLADEIKKIKLGSKTKYNIKNYSQEEVTKNLLKLYANLVERKKIQEKILETGWQSWSTKPESSKFKYPLRNFSPDGEYYLPQVLQTRKHKKPAVGWCSWNAFWWKIDEEKILKNAEFFSKRDDIPVNYILIDDGWTRWGDWKTCRKNSFPSGMKALSDSIHKKKLKAGIRIAPFLVDPKSKLVEEHPELLVKRDGRFVEGFRTTNFDRYFFASKYILDFRKKKAREYLESSLTYLLDECKYDLIKLDFLYAVYMIPNISPKYAGKFLNDFLKMVKERYPSVYTIACGMPLVPSIGVVDSVRIGPDSIMPVLTKFPIVRNMYHRRRIKLIEKNIDKRLWMEDYWNLDPDALVVRNGVGVGDKQITQMKNSFKKISKGNIFLGDDMTVLDEERIKKYILPIFKK